MILEVCKFLDIYDLSNGESDLLKCWSVGVLECYNNGYTVPSERKIFFLYFSKTPRVERASGSEREKRANETNKRRERLASGTSEVSVSFEKYKKKKFLAQKEQYTHYFPRHRQGAKYSIIY